jgi:hypothetical protein
MEEEQTWHLQMQAYQHLQSTIERITKPPRAERKIAPGPELLLCVIGAGTSSPIQVPLNLLNWSVHYHMVRVMNHANKAMEKIISTRPIDIIKIILQNHKTRSVGQSNHTQPEQITIPTIPIYTIFCRPPIYGLAAQNQKSK